MDQFPLFAPGDILDIEGIEFSDIVLYAVIYGLCKTTGYSFASNEYLGKRMKVSVRSIQRSMKRLHGFNLIFAETDGNNRKIFLKNRDMPVIGHDVDGTLSMPAVSHLEDSSIFLINKDNKSRSKVSFKTEIEELYKMYPNKKGKSKGLIKLCKDINTKDDLSLLTAAIQNYAAECKTNKTEVQYIKHFSTFANCWQDYIEPTLTAKPNWQVVKLVNGKLVSNDE